MNPIPSYRCMLVDDESHAIELLTDYIEAVPQLHLVKAFQDPMAALMDSQGEERYDFIFLDIDMPRLSGLELARAMRANTHFLVFTTAHPRYAIEAFEVQADHFLLKPFSLSKFAMTIDQLLKSREKTVVASPCPDSTFFIKSDQKNKLVSICFDDIIAVEGMKNYVMIYTPTQKHMAYLTMKETEDTLVETGRFIRVHRSFIVSKKHIEVINGHTVHLKGGLEAPVGDSYKKLFYAYLAGRTLLSGR